MAAESTPLLDRPARLLPYAILAVVGLGTVHLLMDVVEFGNTASGTISGLLTDSKTIIAAFGVLVGLYAVLAPDEGSRAAIALVDRYRSEPAKHFPPLVYALGYVSVLHVIFAQWSARGSDNATLIMLFSHDMYFLAAAVGIVTVLGTAAAARAGQNWARDADARQLTLLSLYGAAGFGALYALFRLLDQAGDDFPEAVFRTSFALLEATVATVLLLSGLRIVRHLAGSDDTDRFKPAGRLEPILSDPEPVFSRALKVVATLSVLYVLFMLISVGDAGSARLAVRVFTQAFEIVTAIVLIYLVREFATAYGPMGALETESSTGPADAIVLLRRAVLIVVALGLLAALASFVAYDSFSMGSAWYFVFNRLLRAAAAAGALVGVWALHAHRLAPAN